MDPFGNAGGNVPFNFSLFHQGDDVEQQMLSLEMQEEEAALFDAGLVGDGDDFLDQPGDQEDGEEYEDEDGALSEDQCERNSHGEREDEDDDDDDDDDEMPGFRKALQDARKGGLLGPLDKDEELRDAVELEQSLTLAIGSKREKRRLAEKGAYRSRLTPEGTRLIGEANSLFLSGDYEQASRLLHEVIRLCANAYEPYNTLGMIHEERNEPDKAALFYIMAAHLKPKDAELWKRAAYLSREAKVLPQAAYCYKKAVKAAPEDEDALWDRSIVYLEMNDLPKAAEGYASLLRLRPFDLDLAQDVAKLYLEMNDVPKAIDIFEAAMLADPSASQKFSFDHLNLVADLYIVVKNHDKAYQLITEMAPEIFARMQPGEKCNLDHLPLDLSIKLGICQLYRGETEAANKRFAALEGFDINAVSDLFFDVAEALVGNRKYQEALEKYQRLQRFQSEVYDKPNVWLRLAECFRALDKMDEAIAYYGKLAAMFPEQREFKLTLAELFDKSGRPEKANEIREKLVYRRVAVDQVGSLISSTKTKQHLQMQQETVGGFAPAIQKSKIEDPVDTSASDRNLFMTDSVKETLTAEKEMQQLAARFASTSAEELPEKFQRAKELWNGIMKEGQEASEVFTEFHILARALVLSFQSCDRFFTGERIRPFCPTSRRKRGRYRKKGKENALNNALEDAIARGAPTSEAEESSEDVSSTAENDSPMDIPVVTGAPVYTSHMGLEFSEWLDINGMYAIFLVKMTQLCCASRTDPFSSSGIRIAAEVVEQKTSAWLKEATDTLTTACKANIFYYDTNRQVQLQYLRLCVGLHARDIDTIYDIGRFMMTHYDNSAESCSLFTAIFGNEVSAFAHSRCQKFMMRQARSAGTAVTLVTEGHSFSVSKSYSHALVSYARAQQLAPEDPLIPLFLGVTYLHRATQRSAGNRHAYVTNAFAFLFRYLRLRSEEKERGSVKQWIREQECYYNLARGFHTVGMLQFATQYYEKVLNMSDSWPTAAVSEESMMEVDESGEDWKQQCDLCREAAYNLHLIYLQSESPLLAKECLEKYCIV